MRAMLLVFLLVSAFQDARDQAFDLRKQASAASRAGNSKEAEALESRALKLFEKAEDLHNAAWAHSNIGYYLASQGKQPEAAAEYADALRVAQKAGVADVEDRALINFSKLLDPKRKEDQIRSELKAMAQALRKKNLYGRSELLLHERDYYNKRGDAGGAMKALDKLVALNRELKYRYGEALMLHSRGVARSAAGDPEAALSDYRAALKIRTEIEDSEGRGWTLNNMGYALLKAEKLAGSEEKLNEAASVFEGIRHRAGHLKALENLAAVHRKSGDEKKLKAVTESLTRLRGAGRPGKPGAASVSYSRSTPSDALKNEQVLFEVTWTGSAFEFREPGNPLRNSIGAHDQPSEAKVGGIRFTVARRRLWYGRRMIFLAKGETAEVTKGGVLRKKGK